MHVRPVRPGEWARLRAFRLRALASDPSAFGATLAEEEALPEQAWRARAAPGEEGASFVAEEGPSWVGTCAIRSVAPDEAELMGMWVAPEARGRGAGRALVEAACAWARERGAARVTLWVNVAQSPALALYARCGFSPLGEPRQGTRHPERRYQRMGRDA